MARTRRIALSAALLLAAFQAAALDLGVSLATWSFAGTVLGESPVQEGLYGRTALVAGIAPWLELEVYALLEAAPEPLRETCAGIEAALPLTGSRNKNYFNLFASLGFAQGLRLDGGLEAGESYVTLRLIPVSIGNPYYGRRDRVFSIGAFYGLGGRSLTLVWSFLACDYFFGDHPGAGPAAGR